MKKTLSRMVAVALSVGTVLTAATGMAMAGEASASLDATSVAGKKIGLMIYSTTTPWAINIIEGYETLCKAFGVETAIVEAGNPGEVMTAAENLGAAGVDAVLCMMDGSIGDKVQEYFDSKGIYVSYTWGNYIDAEYYDALSGSNYYAGSISSTDYDAAYAMTQHCIDLGADKWVFLGMPEGSGVANDQRAVGFKACLADNGMELLSEQRTYDKVEGSQNLITNFPDLNGFGAGLNAAKNAGGVLESSGLDGANQVYMFCYEAAEDYILEYFENERLHGCADGCIGDMELAFALVVNALAGNKIDNADYRMPYLIAYNAEEYQAMHELTYDGNLPFSVEELAQYIVEINPEADGEMFEAACANYSIEELSK